MKRRRHTPEQIVRKLREADRLLAEGLEVPEVAKQLEISEATYHRRRPAPEGAGERERQTQAGHADKELQIEALKELERVSRIVVERDIRRRLHPSLLGTW